MDQELSFIQEKIDSLRQEILESKNEEELLELNDMLYRFKQLAEWLKK